MSQPDSPAVSVIMRSKNSDWVIGQALKALYSQEFTDFELYVVDSGSTDRTLAIVQQYPHTLHCIEPTEYFPGRVLNAAIEATRGEILVFLNSDSVMLTPQSLGNLVRAFANPDIAAAFGRQCPRPDAHTWVRRDYAVCFPPSGDTPEWMAFSLPLAGMRRSIFEKRPFYTDAWASEDTEWGVRAKRDGLRIEYVPDATTMHSHNYTLRQLYGRRFVEGEADAYIRELQPSALRTIRQMFRSIAQDVMPHLRARDLGGLLASPVRRSVYHVAHHRGVSLGYLRRRTGDSRAWQGQSVVLASQ